MNSTRFPGKPLVSINGVPMIQRVWQQAINSNVGEVVVACSEIEVFKLIKNLGGRAILTDPNLPSGTDRIYSALMQSGESINHDCIINLQGDMPLIQPEKLVRVLEPIKQNYSIGTIATDLHETDKKNLNVTKIVVEWQNDKIGKAKQFFRATNKITSNIYHHVGVYSYTKESLYKFIKLPKSKNEISLKLEQYRAMDADIDIGVVFESNVPPSVDTKEDLLTVESIIRENNDKY